jgi:hypothetical protein
MLLVPPERNRDNPEWQIEGVTSEPNDDENGEMSNEELNNLRKRLEGLL